LPRNKEPIFEKNEIQKSLASNPLSTSVLIVYEYMYSVSHQACFFIFLPLSSIRHPRQQAHIEKVNMVLGWEDAGWEPVTLGRQAGALLLSYHIVTTKNFVRNFFSNMGDSLTG
jgi:hypothetical protein